jgi:hypothetical protein
MGLKTGGSRGGDVWEMARVGCVELCWVDVVKREKRKGIAPSEVNYHKNESASQKRKAVCAKEAMLTFARKKLGYVLSFARESG